MKKENGVTIISLIAYVVLMTLAVAAVSTITSSFYTNLNGIDKSAKGTVAFSKFNMFILNDMKTDGMMVNEVTENKIELEVPKSNGGTETVRYTVVDNGLYRNSVKICDKIEEYSFSTRRTGPNREITAITVYLKIDNYVKTTTYAVERSMYDEVYSI